MKYNILYIILLLISFIPFNSYASNIIEVKSKKGLNAWIVEEHSLPIVSVKLIFKHTGAAYDPQDKLGLAQFSSNILDEGAGDYDGLAYKKRLEELAIRLSIDVDRDHTYVTIKSLKENLPEAFKLLMLAINSAHISDESIERIKTQTLISIEADDEDPKRLANLLWNQQTYKKHPYSNPIKGKSDTIKNITKADIKHYIKNTFVQNELIISVVGDLNADETKELLKNSLEQLPKGKSKTAQLYTVETLPLGTYQFIEKPNPQSVVVFGSKGVSYKDDDFYPAYILNHILGGGSFESRLMQQLREERGLTYSVYSYLSVKEHSQLLKGSLGTKNSSLEEALALLKEIFSDIQENGVTQTELEAAKQYLIGSYPLRLDTNSKLVDGLSFIQLEDLGKNFMQIRNDLVKKVTLEQVNLAAQKLLNPDNLIITIVGGKN